MTVPHNLPISSSTESTKAKGRPPTAASSVAHLDDDANAVFLHVFVSFFMLVFFIISACLVWLNPEKLTNLERWHDVILDAIVFVYSTVMVCLLRTKRRNDKQMQRELACKGVISIPTGSQLTSILMRVATGIMLVALGVAVFMFRPHCLDLVVVVLCVLFPTALMFLFLKAEEVDRKRLRARYEDASDQV